jgi:hypothetical protein
LGVNLSVVIGHQLTPEEAFELPARLARSRAVAAAAEGVYAVMRPRWPGLEPAPVWQWSWPIPAATVIRDAWAIGDYPGMQDAAGFTLYVGPRAIEAVHHEKYVGFVEDSDGIQTPIRQLCRAFAAEVGSDRVIYLPDSGYALQALVNLGEGTAFEELESRLRACKPPAPTIRAIHTEYGDGGWDVDGYFIDDFSDLA